MKKIVVDSSSLISLSSNCLLWVIDTLKEKLNINFVITPDIKEEVVDKALKIDKYRLGGTRVLKRLCKGVISIEETDNRLTNHIVQLSNEVFTVNGNNYPIIHKGEVGLIPLAKSKEALIMTDERIFERLINNPIDLKNIFESRLHTSVKINNSKLNELRLLFSDVKIMKSSDLIAIAYEKGLLNSYLKECMSKKSIKDFVNGSLWGLKMNGCSISTLDIDEYMKALFK